jgi:hypothetical protein
MRDMLQSLLLCDPGGRGVLDLLIHFHHWIYLMSFAGEFSCKGLLFVREFLGQHKEYTRKRDIDISGETLAMIYSLLH